jgi:glycine/D-amino acid oxidase-like deaminating enzyme
MDVVVVGGGAIGLSSALELAESGLQVTLIDRRDPARGSWAAAGILGPQS